MHRRRRLSWFECMALMGAGEPIPCPHCGRPKTRITGWFVAGSGIDTTCHPVLFAHVHERIEREKRQNIWFDMVSARVFERMRDKERSIQPLSESELGWVAEGPQFVSQVLADRDEDHVGRLPGDPHYGKRYE